MENGTISDIKQKEPPISVGEKFVSWAEKHWQLKEMYSKGDVSIVSLGNESERESDSYPALTQAFRQFIDDEITRRINGY